MHPNIVSVLLAFSGFLPGAALADEVIRIMAANTTSGNGQSYTYPGDGPGNRIFRGLQPDIALVQEMNVGSNSTSDYRGWVDENFGTGFQYFVESGAQIPNGIVSRYPIIQSGRWADPQVSNRGFSWARIDIPGGTDLHAVSVHLLTSGASARNAEAQALVNLIRNYVPAGDFLVIGGDLNTDNRSEACITTFSALVRTSAPYPADHNGNGNTNASRGKPYDWVLPGNNLAVHSTPLVLGGNTYPNGIVFDSRVFAPISSVPPVLFSDSSASNMQHMAVMRAFLVPTNDDPVIAGPDEVPVTLSQNNHPQAFSLTLSATDADENPLQWSISSPAGHGNAAVVAPASGGSAGFSYQPAIGYTGADSFTVRVSDGQGGADEVTVMLNVTPASAYDRWTFAQFVPLEPSAELTIWGAANDPDGDGYTNLAEFAHGLDPQVADAAPNLMSCAVVEGRVELSYKIRMDGEVPALDYGLLSAGSPAGPWTILPVEAYTVTSEVAAGTGFKLRTIRLAGEVEASVRFFRLRMSR